MSPCCIFQQCSSLYYLPVSKLNFLIVTGAVSQYSNGIFLIISYQCSSPCSFTQELVGAICLSLSPALALMLLRPQLIGDVHLCLLRGSCFMLVLRTLLLTTQDICESASVQNPSHEVCVAFSGVLQKHAGFCIISQ